MSPPQIRERCHSNVSAASRRIVSAQSGRVRIGGISSCLEIWRLQTTCVAPVEFWRFTSVTCVPRSLHRVPLTTLLLPTLPCHLAGFSLLFAQGEVLPTLCRAMTFSYEMGPALPPFVKNHPATAERAPCGLSEGGDREVVGPSSKAANIKAE